MRNRLDSRVLSVSLLLALGGCAAEPATDLQDDLGFADDALELTDIGGHPAERDIQDLVDRGILRGFPDGTFRPDGLVTRAQYAAMLAAVSEPFDAAACRDTTSPGCVRFPDVPSSHWANGAIATAHFQGFVRGYPDGTFGPARTLTRTEALVALVNGMGIERDDATASSVLSTFPDAAQVPTWAREAVGDAAAAGLLGNPGIRGPRTPFGPNAPATRGDLASYLSRALEALPRAGWVGDFVARIDRAGGAPCEGTGTAALGEGVAFGTWARERSAVSSVCGQVWLDGVTNGAPESAAEQLDTFVRCIWLDERGEDAAVRSYPVSTAGRVGNNTRFAVSLRAVDPFSPYTCPSVPYWRDEDSTIPSVVAQADCSFEVNGRGYGPSGANDTFRLTFVDYANVADRCAR